MLDYASFAAKFLSLASQNVNRADLQALTILDD